MSSPVIGIPLGAFTQRAADNLLAGALQLLPASGAINPKLPARYLITKAGVAALTLAAPVSGTDDGTLIQLISNTANAHTLTATGLLQTGTASVNAIAFPAFAGATVTLMAVLGKWVVVDFGFGTYTLS